MVKIAFSGAACTGKTTLINNLKTEHPEFKFFTNIVRDLHSRGIEINEKGTVKTQQAVLEQHLLNLDSKENEIQVYDRCLLDWFVFTLDLFSAGKIPQNIFSKFEKTFLENIHRYDIICYIDPEFELQEDGVRNLNKDYYNNIVKIFHQVISNYEIPVFHIQGSVKERMRLIKCLLKFPTNPL